jgi:hypothetical protein
MWLLGNQISFVLTVRPKSSSMVLKKSSTLFLEEKTFPVEESETMIADIPTRITGIWNFPRDRC